VFGLFLTPLFYVLVRKMSQHARAKSALLNATPAIPG
jgi:hypothetical protein